MQQKSILESVWQYSSSIQSSSAQCRLKMMQAYNILWPHVHVCFTEKHGLNFLETSALDSSNVELAFHTILTGEFPHLCFFFSCHKYFYQNIESAFDSGGH